MENSRYKFRAWHKSQKKMYSPEEMAKDQMTLLTTGHFINCNEDLSKSTIIYELIPLQYTGFKDKNGKEIYEGDVLGFYKHPKVRREIEWGFGGFDLPGNIGTNGSPWEIIGNKFENPELLE